MGCRGCLVRLFRWGVFFVAGMIFRRFQRGRMERRYRRY